MADNLCLSEFQPNKPENMIPVDRIENIEFLNGEYHINWKDHNGIYHKAKRTKTQYIELQLKQFRLEVTEIY